MRNPAPAHILRHFRTNDAALYTLAASIALEEIRPKKPGMFFEQLCGDIIGQQLSGRVADVIEARFRALFSGRRITPDAVLRMPEEALRATGMSRAKVRFVKDLALSVREGRVRLELLETLSDGDVITELTRVKGIGPWTAEMFLIFTLGRPDVFSFGDLGLRQGIQKLYGLKNEPAPGYMKRLTRRWMPYRSYAARLLWRYKDAV